MPAELFRISTDPKAPAEAMLGSINAAVLVAIKDGVPLPLIEDVLIAARKRLVQAAPYITAATWESAK